MTVLRALRTLVWALRVNLLPFAARETILCVSCCVEAATRSCGFKLRWVKIAAIGCGPRSFSIPSVIEFSQNTVVRHYILFVGRKLEVRSEKLEGRRPGFVFDYAVARVAEARQIG